MIWLIFFLLTFGDRFIGSRSFHCKGEFGEKITDCDSCMRLPGCVWCYDRQADGMAKGCMLSSSSLDDCKNVIDILNQIEEKENQPLDTSGLRDKKIRMSPQSVNLILRPNSPFNLTFRVALSDNPVDIYFLMDLSSSMNESRSNLIDASESIARKISLLSSSYKIGFGSFSDKLVPPFGMTKRYSDSKGYLRSYGYRHQMKLDADVEEFRQRVRFSDLAGNVDSPESGLEALSQAILCDEAIGWSQGDVRKVVIFISDKEQHYALDGKMGGLYKLSKGVCELVSVPGRSYLAYAGSEEFDYPSFGQIRHELRKKNVIVIFAIESFMVQLYRELSIFLQGTDNVGALTDDPSSIEKIVVEQYQSIKNRIILSVEVSNPETISYDIMSDCKSNKERKDSDLICDDVETQKPYTFFTQLTASPKMCTEDSEVSLSIQLQGFERDRLNVKAKCGVCSCSDVEPGSRICSGNGNFVCGGCQCYDGFSGKFCECNNRNIQESSNEDFCRFGEDISVAPCKGRGECVCGKCVCEPEFIGRSCQCRTQDCPGFSQRSVCSENGICECPSDNSTIPVCKCDSGFSGKACDCTSALKGCKDSLTENKICSDRGACQCGKCENCVNGFQGKFCQIDPIISVCNKLVPCIRHYLFRNNATTEEIESTDKDCDSTFIGSYFRSYIDVGCKIDDDPGAVDSYSLLTGRGWDCESMIESYNRSHSHGENEENDLPSRGDLGRLEQILKIDVTDYKFCTFRHEDCNVEFFHNRLDSDSIYKKRKSGAIYIVYGKNEKGQWTPNTNCRQGLSLPFILGSSIGSLLTLGLLILILYWVIVTTQDKRAVAKYEAWKEANIQKLSLNTNPMYISKSDIDKNK